jgi:small subunit ribosomal protein S4
VQLRAKQNAKHFYGVRERQFRRYIAEAQRAHDMSTGDRLLQILELRLDNVVHRLGFAGTRAQARQFVNHGHVDVNGRRCDIPSRRLATGDIVSIKGESLVRPIAQGSGELVDLVPSWLLTDQEALIGRVVSLPARAEIQVPLEEQMIVEFYSRV